MDQSVIPAEESGTPDAGAAVATPASPAAETTDSTASTTATVQPPAPAPKPDLTSILGDPERRQALLKDPEFRREMFKHPETVAEMEHRIASEAGRRAKAEFERYQQQETARQAQENARLERERLKSMDEYELGVYQKQQLAQQEQEEALQQRLQPLQEEMERRYLRETGEQVFNTVYGLAQEAGAAPEELSQLNPGNYPSLAEYIKGAIKFMGSKEGKKLAKEMAKVEANALVEERLGEQRDKNPSPKVLAAGEPSMSNEEFLAAYAAGKTNDHKRAMQVLGR